MAWKPSGKLPLEGLLLSGQEEGYQLQGVYKGFRMVDGPDGDGEQKCHSFDEPDGEPLDVLGFGLLDHILADEKQVKEGDLVRVTYLGKKGKYHKCKVEVDDGKDKDEDGDL